MMKRDYLEKFVVKYLISSFIIILLTAPVLAEWGGYFFGGKHNIVPLKLGRIKNGNSGEIEFRAAPNTIKEEPNYQNKEIYFFTGLKTKKNPPYFVIWKKDAYWYAAISLTGEKKDGKTLKSPVKFNEKGTNALKFQRKSNNVFLSLNGRELGQIPAEKEESTIQIDAYGELFEYQWKSRNYRLPRRVGELNLQYNVPSGHFLKIDPFYRLKNGERVKIYFTIQEVHYHPKWGNNILFYTGIRNAYMMRRKDENKAKIDYRLDPGKMESDDRLFELKPGTNMMEIMRKGNQATYILNGELLRKITITGIPRIQPGEEWYIWLTVVAMKVKIRAIKQ